MSFVVLQPGSLTNLSARYRVVDFEAWLTFVNEEAPSYPYTAYDNTEDAQHAADAANRGGDR